MQQLGVHGMNWILKDKRLAIYLRDGMTCAYCGSVLEDGITLTLDHIIPRSRGGTNKAYNLITSCAKCNKSKGDRQANEFITTVAAYLNHGITATMIEDHIYTCLNRDLKPFREIAKEIISLRPTWRDALETASSSI